MPLITDPEGPGSITALNGHREVIYAVSRSPPLNTLFWFYPGEKLLGISLTSLRNCLWHQNLSFDIYCLEIAERYPPTHTHIRLGSY